MWKTRIYLLKKGLSRREQICSWQKEGCGEGMHGVGVKGSQMQAIIYRMHKQQYPTV